MSQKWWKRIKFGNVFVLNAVRFCELAMTSPEMQKSAIAAMQSSR